MTIRKNITVIGAGADQTTVMGGSPVIAVPTDVTVRLSRITVAGGHAIEGAGIDNYGRLVIGKSRIMGNQADEFGSGGGIQNAGMLTVVDSIISNNIVAGYGNGGGVSNRGEMTVTGSTISDNETPEGYGSGIWDNGQALLQRTTVSGNSGGQSGGGLYTGGPMTIVNSTIADNSTASGPGGGIENFGILQLINSTVSGNAALSTYFDNGSGGGIYTFDAVDHTLLANTVVAGNTAVAIGPDCMGPLLDGNAGHSANFIGIGDYCGLSNGTNSDRVGSRAEPIHPLLGPLADNGGPTQTMRLLPGSPLIATGYGATCLTSDISGVHDTDQRGALRHAGAPPAGRGVCDIGAYDTGGP